MHYHSAHRNAWHEAFKKEYVIDAVRRPRCADSQGESKTGANSPSKYILDADNRQEAHASGINADNMFAV